MKRRKPKGSKNLEFIIWAKREKIKETLKPGAQETDTLKRCPNKGRKKVTIPPHFQTGICSMRDETAPEVYGRALGQSLTFNDRGRGRIHHHCRSHHRCRIHHRCRSHRCY